MAFDSVNLNNSFVHFSHRALTDHKTASWGRIWIGPQQWQTSKPFWVECTISRVDMVLKNEDW